MQVLENLSTRAGNDGAEYYVCDRCDAQVGPAVGDFRQHCLTRELPLTELGYLFPDPLRYVDDEFVYREILCPQCGGLFESSVDRADLPVATGSGPDRSGDRS